jgi:hypothetical protein
VRFQIPTEASMKMTVFWDVPRSLVEVYRRFSGACCLHHQCYNRRDDRGSNYLWNVGKFLQDYTAQHHRRHSSSFKTKLPCFIVPAMRNTVLYNVSMLMLAVTQLHNEFSTFYETRSFITVFTSARHLPLPWARWIQPTPSHHISLRSILILSSRVLLSPPRIFPLFLFLN